MRKVKTEELAANGGELLLLWHYKSEFWLKLQSSKDAVILFFFSDKRVALIIKTPLFVGHAGKNLL